MTMIAVGPTLVKCQNDFTTIKDCRSEKLQDERCNYLTEFFYFGKVVTLITKCACRPSFGRCHSSGNRFVSHVNNKQSKLKRRYILSDHGSGITIEKILLFICLFVSRSEQNMSHPSHKKLKT